MKWYKQTTSTLLLQPCAKVGECHKRGGGKNVRAGGWREACEVLCSGHGVTNALMSSQQLRLSAQNQVSQNSSVVGGVAREAPKRYLRSFGN